MDSLIIRDLELWTRIGVPEEERAVEQRLLVTVELSVDTRQAAAEDDVERTIDYDRVAKDLRVLAQTERKTIERFAEDATGVIFDRYKPEQVRITVKKFVIPGTKCVSITIARP